MLTLWFALGFSKIGANFLKKTRQTGKRMDKPKHDTSDDGWHQYGDITRQICNVLLYFSVGILSECCLLFGNIQ